MAADKTLYMSFAQSYYQSFDTNRSTVVQYYHDEAQLQFENDAITGKQNILQKFMSLPFQAIRHIPTTVDGQLLPMTGNVPLHMIVINGMLKTDEDPPHSFLHSFILAQVDGSFVVTNEVFRLGVHDIPV